MPKPKIPINKEVLRTRISYIEDSLQSLGRFKGIQYEEFHSNPDHFRIAFYDLHRSLEAIMDIGSHIQEFQGPDHLHTRISRDSLKNTGLFHLILPVASWPKWPVIGIEWFIFTAKSRNGKSTTSFRKSSKIFILSVPTSMKF